VASVLFTPCRLRGLELRNRIVVSPMAQYSAIDGMFQPWHTMHLGGFAKSNPGAVITEACAITAGGRISTTCTGLWNSDQEFAAKRLVSDIRMFSSTPLGVQLGHAGRKGSTRKASGSTRVSVPFGEDEGGWTVVGPSSVPYDEGWPSPVALDAVGLRQNRMAWVDAAMRADRCGFDLLEIHAAHGYLLSSFFSALANCRTDEYGGDLERRMRFPLEVISDVRAAWPSHKPLGVRINGADWIEGGSTIEDAVRFAHALQHLGVDYVVASAGNVAPGMRLPPLDPGYMAQFAARIRKETGIVSMAVGLIIDPRFAESLVASGAVDLVAVGRAFLDDPNWTYHAAQALGVEFTYERAYDAIRPRRWPGHRIAREHPSRTEPTESVTQSAEDEAAPRSDG